MATGTDPNDENTNYAVMILIWAPMLGFIIGLFGIIVWELFKLPNVFAA